MFFTSCFCWSSKETEKPRHCKIVLLDESHMIHELQVGKFINNNNSTSSHIMFHPSSLNVILFIHLSFSPQESTRGQDLLELVCRHLNLIETAYFGLRYVDPKGQAVRIDLNSISCLYNRLLQLLFFILLLQRWLNLSKKLCAEVKGKSVKRKNNISFPPLMSNHHRHHHPFRYFNDPLFWCEVVSTRPMQVG